MSYSFSWSDLSLNFDGERLLLPWSGSFESSQKWLVTGSNGAGKSSVIRQLAELAHQKFHIKCSFCAQELAIDHKFPILVEDFLKYSLNLKLFTFKSKKIPTSAIDYLTYFKADHLLKKPISHLSKGQWQKILIARTLASESDLYFFDEPTSSLDHASRDLFFELLFKKCTSFIIVLHEKKLSQFPFTHHLNIIQTTTGNKIELKKYHEV